MSRAPAALVLALALAKIVFLLGVTGLVLAPLAIWFERRSSGLAPSPSGASDADPGGLLAPLRPFADHLRGRVGENPVPRGASRWLYPAAPLVAFLPVLACFAVLPFGGVYHFGDTRLSLVVADADWGVLFVFAMGSLAAYAPALAGWAESGSPSRLAGLRDTALTLSYQVALAFSLVGSFLVFGTLQPSAVAAAQDRIVWLFGVLPLPTWGALLQPLGLAIALVCLLAPRQSAARERSAGERDGAHAGFFFAAEFLERVWVAGLVATLFLGAWSIPYLPQERVIGAVARFLGEGFATGFCLVLHVATFFAKVAALVAVFASLRSALSGARFERAMSFCWKLLLPASLLNLAITGGVLLVLAETP